MLVRIPQVLDAHQVGALRARLDAAGAAWVDGRVTAGNQAARWKRNLQIDEGAPLARELGALVLSSLERNALFISSVLPHRIYPPMFNRYDGAGAAEAMHYGDHVDNSVRVIPGTVVKLRTDVSATLFLTPPDQYGGGELIIEDTYGAHSAKLAAGDMIVYPASSVHRVAPVTRGSRTACFLWMQSLVRDDARRALLFDLDNSIQRLNAAGADESARSRLTACYHNLLRMWAETS
jgi:PKHD-type hydroxylase